MSNDIITAPVNEADTKAAITDKTIPQMPTTLRRQLTETLGYVTNRKEEMLVFRKKGDSEPRTYEEYRMGI